MKDRYGKEIPLSMVKFRKKIELGSGFYLPENYQRINRNAKCPCGSGKKYKQCHWKNWN